MSSWLRNIQGQLTDLANEVLSEANDVIAEAREEVADPDTELIVAKKKCAEAEKQLAIESAKVGSLEEEKKHLEQQVYDAHVEMDSIGTKLNGMVKQRDDEIKKLKNQIEQIHESGWNEAAGSDEDQLAELKSQVAHWKSIAEEGKSSEELIPLSELERKLEEMRQKKEHELQAIMESHAESMVELREMYEEKLAAMQVMPYNASSSTSNADAMDAVLLDRDELCKAKSSTNGSDVGDRPVVVDLGSHDELVDERIRQIEAELERCKEEKEEQRLEMEGITGSLQTQNDELVKAYDELNTEFEEFKERNAVTENRNNDLTHRIDSLKANLIEYEERYELCKKENAETVAQLEKLSGDFARLRSGVANVSQRREDCDSMVNEEVEKLRNALDESRSERERLRNDVQKFQVAVSEIDTELEKLREANRTLIFENDALNRTMNGYEERMTGILSSSEEDIVKIREQFQEVKENHQRRTEALMQENDALREESEAIKKQRDIVIEESRLVKEVNEKLKQKAATEEGKIKLLEEKAQVLQQIIDRKEEEERKAANAEDEDAQALKEIKQSVLSQLMTNFPRVDIVKDQEEADQLEDLRNQLKEVLEANAEKTEECDRLRAETRSLEREVDLRQNCVDEMIAQTNTLQAQQETMSAANKVMQTQILMNERTIVQLQDELKEEKEKTEQKNVKIKRLEEVIVGNDGSQQEDAEEQQTDSATMKRYIAELQTKLAEVEEELMLIKELKQEENKEAAEVRKKLEKELFESEQVDRGLLEGIEKRVLGMEEQLAVKNQMLEQANLYNTLLEQKLQVLVETVDVLKSEPMPDTAEIEEVKQKLEASIKMNILLTEELDKTRESLSGLDELRAVVSQMEQEKEHLKSIATTHHDESVKYYEQFQTISAENQKVQAHMEQMNLKIQELESKLASDSDSHEKRAKELQRLREHLMIVEENSTREAVEAENRETELRSRVRELEAKGHAVEEGVTESTQQYQVQIASLTSKLESVERSAGEWRGKYENEVKAREQTQEALSSLQNVVRELSVDHERDAAAASHRNLELQSQIATLNEEISQIREELDRQSIGRQAAEEETDRRKLQLDSKQKIIEDLEVQIEELRSPSKAADSYRIDDSTLRQLFLNYFTAEPAKRADVAMLLGSILEYPSEEMEKFRSAVRQSLSNPSSSMFSFGSRGSPATGGTSISEQFIRFLEAESESSRTAPHLPVRSETSPSPQMSLDSPRQKSTSPPNQASASSSAAALDSLLR